jgi:hypothetical protein
MRRRRRHSSRGKRGAAGESGRLRLEPPRHGAACTPRGHRFGGLPRNARPPRGSAGKRPESARHQVPPRSDRRLPGPPKCGPDLAQALLESGSVLLLTSLRAGRQSGHGGAMLERAHSASFRRTRVDAAPGERVARARARLMAMMPREISNRALRSNDLAPASVRAAIDDRGRAGVD